MAFQSGQRAEMCTHLRTSRVLFVYETFRMKFRAHISSKYLNVAFYRLEISLNNHLPRDNSDSHQSETTFNNDSFFDYQCPKRRLETSSKNSRTQIKSRIMNQNHHHTTDGGEKRKPALPTRPPHHPDPQVAGAAGYQPGAGATDARSNPQNPKPNHLQIGLKGGGGRIWSSLKKWMFLWKIRRCLRRWHIFFEVHFEIFDK